MRQTALTSLLPRASLVLKETFLEGCKGRDFHTGFYGQRGKRNSIPLLTEAITASRNKAQGISPELILFLSQVDNYPRTGIMVADNICHCADLKLKEGLNTQAEKLEGKTKTGL